MDGITVRLELKTELETNVFPHIDGVLAAEESGGVLVITIEESTFAVTRSAILTYYEAELFEFIRG